MGDNSHGVDPNIPGGLDQNLGQSLCLFLTVLVTSLTPLDVKNQVSDSLRYLLADDGGHDQAETAHGVGHISGSVHQSTQFSTVQYSTVTINYKTESLETGLKSLIDWNVCFIPNIAGD